MNHPHTMAAGSGDASVLPWLALVLLLGGGYAFLRWRQPAAKRWDHRRSWSWYGGLLVAGISLVGPIADSARTSFASHMWGHLLLGMLAPILLVLGAPVTLLLRALSPRRARSVVGVAASLPCRLLMHPIAASVLHIGGLIVLYRTGLFQAMRDSWWIGVLVHIHVLAAGYLFAAAMIGIDPVRHRAGYPTRAMVMVLALGVHAILAKSFYAHPPLGVPIDDARIGSQVMYYGGDAVDILLIGIFCWQWYRATAPRLPREQQGAAASPVSTGGA